MIPGDECLSVGATVNKTKLRVRVRVMTEVRGAKPMRGRFYFQETTYIVLAMIHLERYLQS